MGRSVCVPRDAAVTYYFPFEGGYDDSGDFDEVSAEIQWDNMLGDIREALSGVSENMEFEPIDRWNGELHGIATNGVVTVVLSEYMGFCSLSLVPTSEPLEGVWGPVGRVWERFAAAWAERHEDDIKERLQGVGLSLCVKLGTFSNGESVYQPAS